MTDKIVVLSSCGSSEEGLRIARALVEAKLAACVSVTAGATSVYRWEGRLEEASEAILLIKSARRVLDRLREELLRLHSYDLPEMLVLDVAEGPERYLDWIEGEIVKEDRT